MQLLNTRHGGQKTTFQSQTEDYAKLIASENDAVRMMHNRGSKRQRNPR